MRFSMKYSLLVGIFASILFFYPEDALAATLFPGDIVAAIGDGTLQVYTPFGAKVAKLHTGVGGFTTGMATDRSGDLYVTNFSAGSVSEFNADGILLGAVASGYANPESIVFNRAGQAYVGDAGDNVIHAIGGPDFKVAVQNRGADWIDLASNQKTFYYTSEGDEILRYNISKGQLKPFTVNLPGQFAYQVAILRNGEVLVADQNFDLLLNKKGMIVTTYNLNDSGMSSISVTPNGQDFWTGSFRTGLLYEVNIASGDVLRTINTHSGSLYGIAVYGARTAGGGVPEPSLWLTFIVGIGATGASLRTRRRLTDRKIRKQAGEELSARLNPYLAIGALDVGADGQDRLAEMISDIPAGMPA